jgi:hypothetical protein
VVWSSDVRHIGLFFFSSICSSVFILYSMFLFTYTTLRQFLVASQLQRVVAIIFITYICTFFLSTHYLIYN